jgi:hypothetical protein
MNAVNPERVGLLVVRVWLEMGAQQPRARIIARVNVDDAREMTYTASSADEVCELVRHWMSEFLAG